MYPLNRANDAVARNRVVIVARSAIVNTGLNPARAARLR
jgi:hypothetical protein